ncbi:polysaccharide deacetylase family protein [Neobacillus sp. OS1-33]|uniref:polysaccharide deacetylase family protein n=1 Tax=Neobacillus sp. OS1-33 TaxID=3070683 RepID=UPI0027E1211B|nr:polysaccharide deacetylase family protein [Neobacillus sp. OS1-33]WML24849.1 polysaccharide deacetylase family protein [Neobacillus sp. OS1-33]
MLNKTSTVFLTMILLISTCFFSTESTYASEISTNKIVYLTFDDGPNRYTPKILDILKKKKAHATFFLIEGNIKRNPKTVQRMIKEGNYPALHSVSHDVHKLYRGSSNNVAIEMEKTRQTLLRVSKFNSRLTRAPYGSKPYMKKPLRDALAKRGFKMWDWDVDTLDWKYNRTRPTQITSRVKSGLKGKRDPIVILFHDSRGTAEQLPIIIDYLRKKGYKLEVYDPNRHVVKNFWNDKRL